MIQGVIFDMDGLMFDTERMWATFWEPALAALGLPYKEGLAEAERGTAGETSRNIVRSFYGEDCDANAIIDSLQPRQLGPDPLLQDAGVRPAGHPLQARPGNLPLGGTAAGRGTGPLPCIGGQLQRCPRRGGGRLRHRDGARPAPRRRRDAQPVHGRVQEPDRGLLICGRP